MAERPQEDKTAKQERAMRMGLDFSHGSAQWAYSGFMRFRTKLAAEVGIALNCMESFAWDFSNDKPYEKLKIYGHKDGDLSDRPVGMVGIQPVVKWATVKDDVVPLLNHSDCDGSLTADECRKVAPRLRELVSSWNDGDRDKVNALLLADGMDEAASKNEDLEFI